MTDGSPYDEFDCTCGAPGCRRRVTGSDWQRPELQARYAGHFSPYLERRIARLSQPANGTKHRWASPEEAMSPETADSVVGRQFICDYWGCQGNIGSAETVLEVLKDAVQRANATLLELFIHQFSPQGLTAIAMIAESHIIIHTWPEKGYIALDVFTCGNKALPEKAVETVRAAFAPSQVQTSEVRRRARYELQ
jgi:S-adenosylmethionine decarboxylase